VKYACITRHHGEYPVRLMCRVLAVAPAGYYASRSRAPSARAITDERVLLNVRAAYRASQGTYGAPRIHRDLRANGLRVGKKRVARLMRYEQLVGRGPRRGRVRTTDSHHAYPIAPNLLNRQFGVSDATSVTGLAALDRTWVSDITYIPTRAGWLYLAVVLDLASRRVIGWAMRDHLEAELALSALRMALARRRPAPGLIHHSDRGVQYACGEYRGVLAAYGMRASMSRKGDCWDNAVAESFFSTLELELIVRHDWHTHDEARHAIFTFIETWYNRKRRHSTLDYTSPAEFEMQLQRAA
jgi:putative transposase